MKQRFIFITLICLPFFSSAQQLSRELRDSFITTSMAGYLQIWAEQTNPVKIVCGSGLQYTPTPELAARACWYPHRKALITELNDTSRQQYIRYHQLSIDLYSDTLLVFVSRFSLRRHPKTGTFVGNRGLCQGWPLAGYAVYNRCLRQWIYKSPGQMYFDWDLERAGITNPPEIF